MENQKRICPLMSNAEKQIECTKDCAFAKPNPIIPECTLIQLTEAIDNLADQIRKIDLPEN